MNGARFVLCCVILWLPMLPGSEASSPTARTESENNGTTTDLEGSIGQDRWFQRITDGLKVDYSNKELILKFSPHDESMEGREIKRNKRETIMQRIGSFMMMIPIGMQLLQLPMAIATVKASLLKSLMIAKVAIFMLFLRVLFMPKQQQKIVIVKKPSEYHQHYYSSFGEHDDEKPGWLGKGPAWMNS